MWHRFPYGSRSYPASWCAKFTYGSVQLTAPKPTSCLHLLVAANDEVCMASTSEADINAWLVHGKY